MRIAKKSYIDTQTVSVLSYAETLNYIMKHPLYEAGLVSIERISNLLVTSAKSNNKQGILFEKRDINNAIEKFVSQEDFDLPKPFHSRHSSPSIVAPSTSPMMSVFTPLGTSRAKKSFVHHRQYDARGNPEPRSISQSIGLITSREKFPDNYLIEETLEYLKESEGDASKNANRSTQAADQPLNTFSTIVADVQDMSVDALTAGTSQPETARDASTDAYSGITLDHMSGLSWSQMVPSTITRGQIPSEEQRLNIHPEDLKNNLGRHMNYKFFRSYTLVFRK
ncbi:hypothetical protein B0O99DRAFT_18223 [Bisporella sp. PMI_857]|nr:hypothetical protein B0O99DRAFT_18223 [Bisporella sp. PMI_857]